MSYKHECAECGKRLTKASVSGLCLECRTEKDEAETIKIWKETGYTGCKPGTTLKNCVRRYIYNKQDNLCSICGMNRVWNNKSINFILDHIDGNAANDWEENLRLICPNCDSQLDTFKSKNKNSARTSRKTIK